MKFQNTFVVNFKKVTWIKYFFENVKEKYFQISKPGGELKFQWSDLKVQKISFNSAFYQHIKNLVTTC